MNIAMTTIDKGLSGYDRVATSTGAASSSVPECPSMTMRVQLAFKEVVFSALLIGAAIAIVGASISTLVI